MATPAQIALLSTRLSNDMIKTDDSLTNDEIVRLTNRFIRRINFDDLDAKETDELIDYAKEIIPNDNLKSSILETINVLKSRPRKGELLIPGLPPSKTDVKIRTGPIITIETPEQRIIDARRIIEISDRNIDDALDRATRSARPTRVERTALAKETKNLAKIFNSAEPFFTTKEKADFIDNALHIIDASGNIETRVTTKLQLDFFEENKKLLLKVLKRAEKDFQPITQVIPEQKLKLSAKLPTTKQNLKEFIKSLQNELDEIQKKDKFFVDKIGKEFRRGLAVHMPHKTHNIGDIKILSDDTSKVKEIIIEPFATGKDVLKLVHALTREPGVLLTLKGEDVFDIKGPNNINKLVEKILDLIKKTPKRHALRLVYKPASQFGGNFIGGVFTQALYNKDDISKIIAHKFALGPRGGLGVQFLPQTKLSNQFDFLMNPIKV